MDSPWIAKNRLLICLFLSSSEIITGHWLELSSHRAWTQMVHIGNIEQLLQTSRLLLSDKRNFMGEICFLFYRTAEFITTEGLLQQNNWWESLKNESRCFIDGGGLLFILRPFIHVITGLAMGEMSLMEFYRTTIFLIINLLRINKLRVSTPLIFS